MASLRHVIKGRLDEIVSGTAWVAIFKDGRSWYAGTFYPEAGDSETGYAFSKEDYAGMQRIAQLDYKAICVNGEYLGGLEGLTLDELERKFLCCYEARIYQLQGDFLDGMVVPPAVVDARKAGVVLDGGREPQCVVDIDALMGVGIETLGLSRRAFQSLQTAGFASIGDLLVGADLDKTKPFSFLKQVQGLGPRSYEEIVGKLEALLGRPEGAFREEEDLFGNISVVILTAKDKTERSSTSVMCETAKFKEEGRELF